MYIYHATLRAHGHKDEQAHGFSKLQTKQSEEATQPGTRAHRRHIARSVAVRLDHKAEAPRLSAWSEAVGLGVWPGATQPEHAEAQMVYTTKRHTGWRGTRGTRTSMQSGRAFPMWTLSMHSLHTHTQSFGSSSSFTSKSLQQSSCQASTVKTLLAETQHAEQCLMTDRNSRPCNGHVRSQ